MNNRKDKRVLYKECPIAGLPFHIGYDDELWDEMFVGARLALVRQKDNEYDENAVAVCLADDYDGNAEDFDFDFILGYVPRTDNAELAAMMDAGYADVFSARVTTYNRDAAINERLRMTIYIERRDKNEERPNLLRVEYLNEERWREMAEELVWQGTIHFRWYYYPLREEDLPAVGDKIVLAHQYGESVRLMLTRVLAIGNDCFPYLDDPEELTMVDDCECFVLTNITGPIVVDTSQLRLFKELHHRQVYCYVSKAEDEVLTAIFRDSFGE